MSRRFTGIVRQVDELGRLVLPAELRRSMSLDAGNAAVEIYVDDDAVILRPLGTRCRICGETDDEKLVSVKDMTLCHRCIEAFSSQKTTPAQTSPK